MSRVEAERPAVLCLYDFGAEGRAALAERFVLADGDTGGPGRLALITNSATGYDGVHPVDWSRVGHIHFYGTGVGGVDFGAARRHGVRVTSAAGIHSACVADHAMALLLAVLRLVPRLDREVHAGAWPVRPPLLQLTGRKVGVLGFGTIGLAVADRLAGFGTEVGYFARRQRPQRPERFFAGAAGIAAWADDLVVTLPGDDTTRHLVGREVLAALGPGGHLVNVGRGEVVDTEALAAALASGAIRGAGLDVIEGEGRLAPEILELPNLVLTPHIGGWSPDSARLLIERAIAVLDDYFAGREPGGFIA